MSSNSELIAHTSNIVASYVGNNNLPEADLLSLIDSIYSKLSEIDTQSDHKVAVEQAVSVKTPKKTYNLSSNMPVEQSVQPDHIICLEDGKSFKTLKRHLKSAHNMTPKTYRKKWGLPEDYPMTAQNYIKERRAAAKKIGLGTERKKPVKAV